MNNLGPAGGKRIKEEGPVGKRIKVEGTGTRIKVEVDTDSSYNYHADSTSANTNPGGLQQGSNATGNNNFTENVTPTVPTMPNPAGASGSLSNSHSHDQQIPGSVCDDGVGVGMPPQQEQSSSAGPVPLAGAGGGPFVIESVETILGKDETALLVYSIKANSELRVLGQEIVSLNEKQRVIQQEREYVTGLINDFMRSKQVNRGHYTMPVGAIGRVTGSGKKFDLRLSSTLLTNNYKSRLAYALDVTEEIHVTREKIKQGQIVHQEIINYRDYLRNFLNYLQITCLGK